MTFPACDAEIYRDGTCVFITHTLMSGEIEEWVQAIARKSGQRVDWHWAGGRAMVLALGDLDRVEIAITDLLPEHDAAFRAEIEALKFDVRDWPPPRYWPRHTRVA